MTAESGVMSLPSRVAVTMPTVGLAIVSEIVKAHARREHPMRPVSLQRRCRMVGFDTECGRESRAPATR